MVLRILVVCQLIRSKDTMLIAQRVMELAEIATLFVHSLVAVVCRTGIVLLKPPTWLMYALLVIAQEVVMPTLEWLPAPCLTSTSPV